MPFQLAEPQVEPMGISTFNSGDSACFALSGGRITLKFLKDVRVHYAEDVLEVKSMEELDAKSSSTTKYALADFSTCCDLDLGYYTYLPGRYVSQKQTKIKANSTGCLEWSNPKGNGAATGKFTPAVMVCPLYVPKFGFGCDDDLRCEKWKDISFEEGDTFTMSIKGRGFSVRVKSSGRATAENDHVVFSFGTVTVPRGMGYKHDNLIDIVSESSGTLKYANVTGALGYLEEKSTPMDSCVVYSPKLVYSHSSAQTELVSPSFAIGLSKSGTTQSSSNNSDQFYDGTPAKLGSGTAINPKAFSGYELEAGKAYSLTLGKAIITLKPYLDSTVCYDNGTIEVTQRRSVKMLPGDEPYHDYIVLVTISTSNELVCLHSSSTETDYYGEQVIGYEAKAFNVRGTLTAAAGTTIQGNLSASFKVL